MMKKGAGKQKIQINKIENPQNRAVCFSKRRKGLFKKARELSALSGAQVAVVVQSQAGRFFVDGSPSFDSKVLQKNSDEQDQEKEEESGEIEELEAWRFWMDLEVDCVEGKEEMAMLMGKLQEIQGKVASRIQAMEIGFVDSLFA